MNVRTLYLPALSYAIGPIAWTLASSEDMAKSAGRETIEQYTEAMEPFE